VSSSGSVSLGPFVGTFLDTLSVVSLGIDIVAAVQVFGTFQAERVHEI
jgi:hypothetical protein